MSKVKVSVGKVTWTTGPRFWCLQTTWTTNLTITDQDDWLTDHFTHPGSFIVSSNSAERFIGKVFSSLDRPSWSNSNKLTAKVLVEAVDPVRVVELVVVVQGSNSRQSLHRTVLNSSSNNNKDNRMVEQSHVPEDIYPMTEPVANSIGRINTCTLSSSCNKLNNYNSNNSISQENIINITTTKELWQDSQWFNNNHSNHTSPSWRRQPRRPHQRVNTDSRQLEKWYHHRKDSVMIRWLLM